VAVGGQRREGGGVPERVEMKSAGAGNSCSGIGEGWREATAAAVIERSDSSILSFSLEAKNL